MNAAATSLGGLLGGALGGVGDVLSAPRRGLMSLLGMPESGSELLADTFGMDQGSALTQALGIGAEMALDPLTYVGMLGAGPMGKLMSMPWRTGAKIDDSIAALNATKAGAQQALSQGNAVAQELRAAVPQVAQGFAPYNLPAIAGGELKGVAMATDDAAAALGGLANPMMGPGRAPGTFPMQVAGGLPQGVEPVAMRGAAGGRMVGRGLSGQSFSGPPLPLMGPEDVAFLQAQGAGAGQSELARQLAVEQLGRALPQAAPGQMSPRQVLSSVEETLPWLMRQQRQYQLNPRDLALAGLVGGGTAGALMGDY